MINIKQSLEGQQSKNRHLSSCLLWLVALLVAVVVGAEGGEGGGGRPAVAVRPALIRCHHLVVRLISFFKVFEWVFVLIHSTSVSRRLFNAVLRLKLKLDIA